MPILVAGITGQVGWEVVRKAQRAGLPVLGFDSSVLDITDSQKIERVVEENSPDLIINCAAYTAVDKAESETDKAFSVNRDGPALLAAQCRESAIPLIHLSTDYVFDGSSTAPYTETDPVSPLGIYGESKEAGEREVRKCLDHHLIIRTSWVYGIHGHNFVKTMIRLGCERKELRVVNDQYGCPTYAGDLADALLRVAPKILSGAFDNWGTYHCCGSTALTWYAFAARIFAFAKESYPLQLETLSPISTEEYPLPAPRPAYSVLDCRKFYSIFGIRLPEVSDSLKTFFNDIQSVGEKV